MQAGDLIMFLKGNKTYSRNWNLERNGHQTNDDHENKGSKKVPTKGTHCGQD
jgi:hypothetical protein